MSLKPTPLQEWLDAHGIRLEPGFVTILKAHAKAYKKRQVVA